MGIVDFIGICNGIMGYGMGTDDFIRVHVGRRKERLQFDRACVLFHTIPICIPFVCHFVHCVGCDRAGQIDRVHSKSYTNSDKNTSLYPR